jgi:cytochrome c550
LIKKEEIAAGHEEGATEEEGATTEEFDPDAVAQGKCISCHGGDLAGLGNFPSLVGTELSKEEIADIILNGKGTMPGNLVDEENIDEMADYILSLK